MFEEKVQHCLQSLVRLWIIPVLDNFLLVSIPFSMLLCVFMCTCLCLCVCLHADVGFILWLFPMDVTFILICCREGLG